MDAMRLVRVGVSFGLVAACAERSAEPAIESAPRAAVVNPALSPELAADERVLTAGRYVSHPAVAWDGTNFLVVWRGQPGRSEYAVAATRVSPDGKVLDLPSTTLGVGDIAATAVAFGGGSYLVAWEDANAHDVLVRRVGVDGKPLGAAVRVWRDGISDEHTPTVAFDGTNFVVVFLTRTGFPMHRLHAVRVSPAGMLLDTPPKTLHEQQSPITRETEVGWPRLSFDGSHYQLLWQQGWPNTKVAGLRFTPALGVVITSRVSFPAAGVASAPALAAGGGEHLAAWQEAAAADQPRGLRAARLPTAGAPAETVTVTTPGQSPSPPAVAFDGARWLVTWADGLGGQSVLRGMRLGGAGAEPPFVISAVEGGKANPAVGCGGGVCLQLWTDRPSYDSRLFAARIKDGAAIDAAGFNVSTVHNLEQTPAVASNGQGHLVVWADSRDGARAIYGTRVSPIGVSLDAPAMALSEVAAGSPAAATDGSRYLVTWVEASGNVARLGLRFVEPGGARGPKTVLEFQPHEPAVAYAAQTYLVLWTANTSTTATPAYDIHGARLDREGRLLDMAPIRVSTTPEHDWLPRLASDGTGFFAVWHDYKNVYGTRIDASGRVLDQPALVLRPADAPASQSRPSVAFDGTNYLVVWEDLGGEVRGLRVSRAGALLDATSLALTKKTTTTSDRAGAVAFDGANYLIPFMRNTYQPFSTRSDTTLNLVVVDPATMTTAASHTLAMCEGCTATSAAPTVSGGWGQGLVAFSRPDRSTGDTVDRVRMFLFSEAAQLGTPCTATAQCGAGRFCVDGVCCESTCGDGARDCQACSTAAGGRANGTCGPVTAGHACTARAGLMSVEGVCSAAAVCTALPPDAGARVDGAAVDARPSPAPDAAWLDAAADMAVQPVDADTAVRPGIDAAGDNGDAARPSGARDAGATDAPAPIAADGGGTAAAGNGGCGCRVPGGPDTSPPALALLLAILALGRRRARRGARGWGALFALLVAVALVTPGCGGGTKDEADAAGSTVDAPGARGTTDAAAPDPVDVGVALPDGRVGATDGPDAVIDAAVPDAAVDGEARSPDAAPADSARIDGARIDPGPRPADAWCSQDQRWCWMNPRPQGQYLTAAWGSGPRDLWVAGDEVGLRWDGARWTQTSFGPNVIRSIAGLGPNDAWAVGDSGTILRWNGTAWLSGGRVAWTDPFFNSSGLTGVWPVGAADVWVTSHFGIARFDGTRWRPVAENINQIAGSFHDVWASSATDVWVVGSHGEVARVAHWDGAALTLTTIPGASALHAVRGTSATDVWAVGAAGTALRWDGKTWTKQSPATTATLRRVWARAADDVWAAGDGGTAFRWNGQTWAAVATGLPHAVAALWGSGADDVWAFGAYGSMLRWNGQAWEPRWQGVVQDWSAVWGSADDDVWIAGGGGAMHWDGAVLRPQTIGGPVQALHGTARDDVWAVGRSGAFHHDGTVWKPSSGCTEGAALVAVRARTRQDAWAAGGSVLCRWNGTTWTPVRTGLNYILDVAPLGDGDVILVEPRRILRLRGDVLTTEHQDDDVLNRRAFSVSPTEVWVTGYGRDGALKQWTATGWRTFSTPNAAPTYVHGSGPNDLWAVGSGGTLLQRTGTAWSARLRPLLTHTNLNGVWSSGSGVVWVVGERGFIWRRWP